MWENSNFSLLLITHNVRVEVPEPGDQQAAGGEDSGGGAVPALRGGVGAIHLPLCQVGTGD